MLLMLLLQSASPAPIARTTATFQSRRVTESSGVAVSRAHSGILWTHNDSGDGPYLYATDLRGTDRGAIRVSGAGSKDWEDIAAGPCPTRPGTCLYIGDTGDNTERRSSVTIYAVPEPDPPIDASDTQRVTAAAAALRLRYPDGAHDVEALYVSPRDTAVYLVSKGWGGSVRLYRAGRTAWRTPGVATAELVQALPISPSRKQGRVVTGAAMRGDGTLVAIRTYVDVHFFVPDRTGRLAAANRPVCSVRGLGRGGEGIAFLDDSILVLTSEADRIGPGAIHTVRCP